MKIKPVVVQTEEVSVSENLAANFELIGKVDSYVRDCLWMHWRENGIQVCGACGYALNNTTGKCTVNPDHPEGYPYTPHGRAKTVGL